MKIGVLESYSTEDLQAEINRRLRPPPPAVRTPPNFTKVGDLVCEYIDKVDKSSFSVLP